MKGLVATGVPSQAKGRPSQLPRAYQVKLQDERQKQDDKALSTNSKYVMAIYMCGMNYTMMILSKKNSDRQERNHHRDVKYRLQQHLQQQQQPQHRY